MNNTIIVLVISVVLVIVYLIRRNFWFGLFTLEAIIITWYVYFYLGGTPMKVIGSAAHQPKSNAAQQLQLLGTSLTQWILSCHVSFLSSAQAITNVSYGLAIVFLLLFFLLGIKSRPQYQITFHNADTQPLDQW